jgi:DNA-binding transcriptional regulator YiaG
MPKKLTPQAFCSVVPYSIPCRRINEKKKAQRDAFLPMQPPFALRLLVATSLCCYNKPYKPLLFLFCLLKELLSMKFSLSTTVLACLFQLLSLTLLAGLVYFIVLLIKALRRYIQNAKANPSVETSSQPLSLGETLKFYRTQHHMTQEFVAEALNISRQAVSKWESDAAVPNTANLLALAKLYNVSPQDLVKN